ncbi:Hypothetical_protein [Hexamita inflata]|uniref:Hypothetical_protein n=1 Tax=Hexamita inflata TaxID=28002 RepID=A0AA86NDV6_9EUKA|nr:Hypothetical protein HINF_LOCUS5349 [Hexamita inflata]
MQVLIAEFCNIMELEIELCVIPPYQKLFYELEIILAIILNLFQLPIIITSYYNYTTEFQTKENKKEDQFPNEIIVGLKFNQLIVTFEVLELKTPKDIQEVEQYLPRTKQFLIYKMLFNVPIRAIFPVLLDANNKQIQRFLTVEPSDCFCKIFNYQLV